MNWTQQEAIELCTFLESLAPQFGCHVALTGGCLYKEGERKDLDVLLYRIRQQEKMDLDGFFKSLKLIDFIFPNGHEEAFVTKAGWKEKYIDFLVPENPDGDYMDCDLITDEEIVALDAMIDEEYRNAPIAKPFFDPGF